MKRLCQLCLVLFAAAALAAPTPVSSSNERPDEYCEGVSRGALHACIRLMREQNARLVFDITRTPCPNGGESAKVIVTQQCNAPDPCVNVGTVTFSCDGQIGAACG